MTTLNYFNARSEISNGDMISVFKAHGFFGRLTQFFTGQYTHSGVAVWMEGGLWMVEINGGRNHAIPLSQLQKFGFDVFEPPKGVTAKSAKISALKALRNQENYGFFTTIVTGFIEYFRIPIVVNWRKGRHCAGFVVGIYDDAGWAMADNQTHTYVISPTKLSNMMKLKFRVVPQ